MSQFHCQSSPPSGDFFVRSHLDDYLGRRVSLQSQGKRFFTFLMVKTQLLMIKNRSMLFYKYIVGTWIRHIYVPYMIVYQVKQGKTSIAWTSFIHHEYQPSNPIHHATLFQMPTSSDVPPWTLAFALLASHRLPVNLFSWALLGAVEAANAHEIETYWNSMKLSDGDIFTSSRLMDRQSPDYGVGSSHSCLYVPMEKNA